MCVCNISEYGVPECLLGWLSSYFHDRKQGVKVNQSMSTWRDVKAGVVQGSVIGPLLFIAYFDKIINDHEGKIVQLNMLTTFCFFGL